QQMSGVDNMNYMYSVNASTGEMRLIVDFDVQTEPNTDLILTQLRQAQAASQLPAEGTNFGVTVQKTLTAPLMLISLYSPSGLYDAKFLANYAYINLNAQLTRVPGIGSVFVFGAGRYAMRLWVRPDQLAKLSITVPEIVSAIQSQNTVNPAGQIGGEPVPKGQDFTYSVRAQGRLTTPEEVGEIVVRATQGRRAGRPGSPRLLHHRPSQRKAMRGHRGVPAAGIERRGGSGWRQEAPRGSAGAAPEGRRLLAHPGYDARRLGGNPGDS